MAGLECEAAGIMVFETGGATPVGAEGCWGVPEDGSEGAVICLEGTEGAAGCTVEPVGVGVNPILAAIEGDDEDHEDHSVRERSEGV